MLVMLRSLILPDVQFGTVSQDWVTNTVIYTRKVSDVDIHL